MQEYTYTLNDDDYIEYLEAKTLSDKMVIFRSLLLTYGSLPILALAVYLMGVRKLWVYLVLVLLFIVWIPLSRKLLWKIINSNIRTKLEEAGNRNYKEMKISVKDGDITVTTGKETKTVKAAGYRLYRHLLIMNLADGSDLLIPQRIFGSEKDLGDLMKELREVKE